MELFLALFYTFIFWIIIRNHRFFRIEGIRKEALKKVFLLKVFIAFATILVYKYYFNNNSFSSLTNFSDGKIMANAILNNPLDFFKMLFGFADETTYIQTTYYQNMINWASGNKSLFFENNHLLIRVNSILMFLSFGFYYVQVVIFCFISFIGLTALYKYLLRFSVNSKFGIFIAVFLLPTVLIFNSGIFDVLIIFFAIGMLLFSIEKLRKEVNIKSILWILLCLILLIESSKVLFLLILPLIISQQIINYFKNIKVWSTYLFVNAFFIIVYSLVLFFIYDKNIFDFIINMPDYMINTLGKPIPFIDKSISFFPSIIENIIILLFIFLRIKFPAKNSKNEKSIVNFSLWFVVLMLIFIGITTTELNTILKLKTVVLPFIFTIFAIGIDRKKCLSKLAKLQKYITKFERKIIYRTVI